MRPISQSKVREFLTDQVRRLRKQHRRPDPRLLARMAWTFQPQAAGPDEPPAADELLPLDRHRAWVLRYQGGRSAPLRSPLLVFAPALDRATGRIAFQAEAAYETLADGEPGLYLDPKLNQAAARLTLLLHWACRDADPAEVRPRPEFPEFWCCFRQDNPPQVEDSPQARALGPDPEAVFIEAARDVLRDPAGRYRYWDRSEGEDPPAGCVWYTALPQALLARDPRADYARHPLGAGPRPELPGRDGEACAGWACRDGRWLPAAQAPDLVLVAPPRGRAIRNPAQAVLEARPEVGSSPLEPPKTWAEALVGWAADHPQALADLALATRLAGQALGAPCPFTEAAWRLVRPTTPVEVPGQSPLQVVALTGAPGPETMTWELPGIEADFYSAGPWTDSYAPATRDPAVDREIAVHTNT